ncbi:unnamed protein product, partial [Rotaria sp. Silwood1]
MSRKTWKKHGSG